ncbi:SCO family protein [Vandammella animalimorsus]|uniref:SCO family protein n=1 Tax=Vandammella animalimorsus TaxID=2029117 RepID=A0A2A2T344_9BURK|nr:SCO family protein [Vandammella animalimorsus]PAT31106.1 SCO family protein [Vandammella animalimorsus]PAX15895.1 SCO family protein [Vandammella animalimorsus]PAX17724.1 SCO family protein [Vandammella animalimorsus]
MTACKPGRALRSRLLAAALVGAALLGLAGCTGSEPAAKFHTLDISGVDYAKGFSMPDAHGQHRSLADFAGKVVFVYFGFAQCPDICPTTMLEMAEVKKLLGEDGDKLQIVFVTVDPERDTPEVMRAYMESFDPQAVALVGNAEQIAAMARDFKVFYEKKPGSTPDTYTIDHSASGYMYDPQGRLRLYVRYGTPVDQIAADVRQLLQGR